MFVAFWALSMGMKKAVHLSHGCRLFFEKGCVWLFNLAFLVLSVLFTYILTVLDINALGSVALVAILFTKVNHLCVTTKQKGKKMQIKLNFDVHFLSDTTFLRHIVHQCWVENAAVECGICIKVKCFYNVNAVVFMLPWLSAGRSSCFVMLVMWGWCVGIKRKNPRSIS